MAWLTTLSSAEQVDYRLADKCGCDEAHAHERSDAEDTQLDYRLDGADRPIERVGSGWSEFGEVAGGALSSDADLDSMRAIMAGRDPRTGEQLVQPKLAVDPRAKLRAAPLVEAVRRAAAEIGVSPAELLRRRGSEKLATRFARLERGVSRDGETHRAPVRDLEAVADAANRGIAEAVAREEISLSAAESVRVVPDSLWDADELAVARKHADDRVQVGNRGYDLVLNMPKSISVLYGLAGGGMAARIEEIYLESVRETAAAVEGWAGYALSGHHGDGRQATRLESSGIVASLTLHRSARPVGGRVGDPHLHAHLMIANLVRGADGKWRTLASGGRDLHRHVAAAGELAKARMRARLTEEFGVGWERDPRTGEWEIAGIGPEIRRQYSRRSVSITDAAGEEATPAQQRTVGQKLAQAKQPVEAAHARTAWREDALAAGIDPERLVADVTGRGGAGAAVGGGLSPGSPTPEELAAVVWDPETGVTANRKTVTRAQVLVAVAAAHPYGLSAAALEARTDEVLRAAQAVRMPAGGVGHQSNAGRWTSADIVAAERVITGEAERRFGGSVAVVEEGRAGAALAGFEREQGFALSGEQRRTAERLLVAGHGVDVVRGVAGAGKTTLMSAVRAGWEAAGYRVEGAATAAVAAANLQAEAGIEARTVAWWLRRIESGAGLAGVDVLVLDEAAMVDDRSMAALVAAAGESGTKVVGIGDPAQLRAVGVGGAFAAVHRLVGGETLTENRRQRGEVDRAALRQWVDGARAGALVTWGEAGRVHAPRTSRDAFRAMAVAWLSDRAGIEDRHDAVADVLVLAARNSDVGELNERVRWLARSAGYVSGPDVTFAVAGGERLSLAVGDVVRVRRNDYRSARGEGPDVLNGFRGVVAEVDARRGVRVEWRRGGRVRDAWLSPEAVGRGDLSLGYAMTIAAAQGLTCERAHVYGVGADAHSLYPAMTRGRQRADLYLAGEALDERGQAEMGAARSDGELVRAAVNAYARTLTDVDEGMVSGELDAARVGLSVADARVGRGPEYARRLGEIEGARERARVAGERAAGLREERERIDAQLSLGRLALLARGVTRAGLLRRREAVVAELRGVAEARRRAEGEARRVAGEAVAEDVALARGGVRPGGVEAVRRVRGDHDERAADAGACAWERHARRGPKGGGVLRDEGRRGARAAGVAGRRRGGAGDRWRGRG